MTIEDRPYIGLLISDKDDTHPYRKVIREAGAVPMELPRHPNFAVAKKLAGVLVSGVGPQGRDVHSTFYREGLPSQNTDPDFDCREVAWMCMLRMWDVPVAATCLGMQLYWVLNGGQLKAGIKNHASSTPGEETTAMKVELEPSSLLYHVAGSRELSVRCMHSQGAALPPIPSGLRVTAFSPDGEIHAVESEDGWSFFGTQFHPERDPNFGPRYYREMFHLWRMQR